MLNQISVEKFKAFNYKQKAELKPITLIYGPNSAGKSSLLQSLLLLKQSVNDFDMENVSLIPKGKFIDLGNYREMVFGHENDANIILSNSFNIEYGPKFLREFWEGLVRTATYETVFGCDESKSIYLNEVRLYYNSTSKPLIILEKDSDKSDNQSVLDIMRINRTQNIKRGAKQNFLVLKEVNKQHPLIKSIYNNLRGNSNELKGIRGRYHTPDVENFDDFYDVIVSNIKNMKFSIDGFLITGIYHLRDENLDNRYYNQIIEDLIMLTLSNYKKLLDSINYLGPLREYPERHYIFSGISPTGVGKSGKYMSDLLFLNEGLIGKVNEWLEKFGIDYKMKINKLDDNEISDVYSMRLIDKKNNISVSPLDVGFGISQILPIIVQSIISHDSIICIEQPEIHIHPRLQTIFGSFITDCINENNQFIIETHSEHIMLRIQKLIREKQLDKDKVSIIYVDRKENGSRCIELRLDDDGDFLDEWPDGFFEEGYEEVFGKC